LIVAFNLLTNNITDLVWSNVDHIFAGFIF
jgi:hypothetical protein